jgi:hypothetical protein
MGHRARGAVVCVCAGLLLACVGVGGAGAASVKVCPSGCAFSQIAPAIAAASAGDSSLAAAQAEGKFRRSSALWGAKIDVLPANRGFPAMRTEFLAPHSDSSGCVSSYR